MYQAYRSVVDLTFCQLDGTGPSASPTKDVRVISKCNTSVLS